jgi:hypothetical protein
VKKSLEFWVTNLGNNTVTRVSGRYYANIEITARRFALLFQRVVDVVRCYAGWLMTMYKPVR